MAREPDRIRRRRKVDQPGTHRHDPADKQLHPRRRADRTRHGHDLDPAYSTTSRPCRERAALRPRLLAHQAHAPRTAAQAVRGARRFADRPCRRAKPTLGRHALTRRASAAPRPSRLGELPVGCIYSVATTDTMICRRIGFVHPTRPCSPAKNNPPLTPTQRGAPHAPGRPARREPNNEIRHA